MSTHPLRHVSCIDCGITREINYTGPFSDRCKRCAAVRDGNQRRAKNPGPWVNDGLCAQVDPELHFPAKGGSARDARRICHSCPVRETCLDWAIDTDQEHGVWGGMSRHERTREAKRRAIEVTT